MTTLKGPHRDVDKGDAAGPTFPHRAATPRCQHEGREGRPTWRSWSISPDSRAMSHRKAIRSPENVTTALTAVPGYGATVCVTDGHPECVQSRRDYWGATRQRLGLVHDAEQNASSSLPLCGSSMNRNIHGPSNL